MSPRTLHLINIALRVGFEKRSRCAVEFVPSQQLIHMTDARPPASPHKESDPLPMKPHHMSGHIPGGVIELFVSVSTRQ